MYGFLDCPVKAMPILAYYAEVIHSGLVASVVTVVCISEGAFRSSLYLSPNVLPDCPIFPHCSQPCCMYMSILHHFCIVWIFAHWWYKYVLDCSVASEVCVDAILTAYAFYAFAEALYMCYHYVSLVCNVVLVIDVSVVVVPNIFRFLCWKFLHSILSVDPWCIFAIGEHFPYV